jgi:quinol monooxygenase YgiN
MTTISTSRDLVTLINVFTVEPSRQQALVDLLTKATDETIRHKPGFVSANIHKSHDGMRVTNYAQWRSREDLDAMLRDPEAQPHLREATALATAVDPHIYDVASVRNGRHVPRRIAIGAAATGATALGALAVGAMAIGAFAVGAMAIGRLAIGELAVRRGRVHKLSIEDVTIGRLSVRELALDRGAPL